MTDRPIILICRDREVSNENHIAYWPENVEIGLKLLAALRRLAQNAILTHVRVMRILKKLAEGKHLTANSLTILCEYLKMEYIDDLGHFMILKEDGVKSVGHENIDKSHIIEETTLSPHLYRLTCYVSC